jgi:outer membrane immunogenic protein
MTRSVLMATAAVGFAMLPLGAADAQTPLDWSGGYVGIHAGYLWGHLDAVPYDSRSLDAPIAGGLFGYNFPMMSARPVQFGVEADFGIAGPENAGEAAVAGDASASYLYDLEWDAHFRVRAGLPGGTVMPFVAAGLALAKFDPFEKPNPLLVGGTVGGGVDFKLGPKVIGRVEGLYDCYIGKDIEDYTLTFHAFTARAALIVRLP